MLALDCESKESAFDSISAIYGVPAIEIESFLRETDLDRHYATTNPQQPADRELTNLFKKAFATSPAPVQRVFWFHLTRAKPGATFARGILPLDAALDDIWDTIFEVFKDTSHGRHLRNLKQNGVPNNYQYNLKLGSPFHGGPYAMLIRESAFRSKEMGTSDYLWLPEIMEDICNGYQKEYGCNIHDDLSDALVPYIVKFWSNNKAGTDYVETAMHYLYCIVNDQEMSTSANICFDGMNAVVPAQQIVDVGSP